MSSTYRQASFAQREGPRRSMRDNHLLWRGNRSRPRRRAAFATRCCLISNRLEQKRPAGPSDQQFAMRPGIHVTPIVEYGKFDWGPPNRGIAAAFIVLVFRTLPESAGRLPGWGRCVAIDTESGISRSPGPQATRVC